MSGVAGIFILRAAKNAKANGPTGVDLRCAQNDRPDWDAAALASMTLLAEAQPC